jgi:catalase
MHPSQLFSALLLTASVAAQDLASQNLVQLKADQLQSYIVDDMGQEETTSAGIPSNSTYSLRIGQRGYVLLSDTVGRKKFIHFTRERQPERAIHASGHGAYGEFTTYGDWSNYTSACWLQKNTTSPTFSRFSTHNPSAGGSEVQRDTHGFATKIYSSCGNQDLVFNHIPSFFMNDGMMFPDMVHSIKAEPDKGFPTGGGYHQTAYDWFTHRPESTLQRMLVQSDLSLPIDTRHIRGSSVHTFRFINAEGKSSLFKAYWEPTLGVRSRIADEIDQIVGYNGDYFREDTYNAIEAGLFPEWEFLVQIFPDDGNYMYKGIDLLDPTLIVPFEVNPPIKFGKMTLNRNPTNWFNEVESVQFAPANTVTGISLNVPDAVLQWRLMAYDEAATHRHGSPNYNQLPVNCPLSGVHNNERDGFMAMQIPFSSVMDSPNNIGGISGVSEQALSNGYVEQGTGGPIARHGIFNDPYTQATNFWYSQDIYGQQHMVNAFRSDMAQITNTSVINNFITQFLNPVDNCFARRVAYGIGAPLPELGSGSTSKPNTTYPSTFPLGANMANKTLPIAGLNIAVLANDNTLTLEDYQTLVAAFKTEKLNFAVIAPRAGLLASGVHSNLTYLTGGPGNSAFYDAVVLGSPSNASAAAADPYRSYQLNFLRTAYGHGKPLIAIGDAAATFTGLGYSDNSTLGVFTVSSAADAAKSVASSLASPGRYPIRSPVDDVELICGGADSDASNVTLASRTIRHS